MEEWNATSPGDPASAKGPTQGKSGAASGLREWSKVRKLALRQLNRFASLEPRVLRGDDPNAIHDMRVASRRLQQILDLACPKPLPREVRQLRSKIRRCRRSLGNVRNCDVLLQRVETTLARKRCANRQAWRAVQQYLGDLRTKSFLKAIQKLGKVNLAVFYMRAKETLDQIMPAPGQEAGLQTAPSNRVEPFSTRIVQELTGVWKEFESQVADSHREATAAAIHKARIGAKRLRYLLEVVDEFNLPGSADVLSWLRKLQQHLGDWHDVEVMEEAIIKMIARPEFLRDHLPLAMATGRLVARNRATKEEFKDKYFRMTLNAPDYQKVKEWVERFLAEPPETFTRA